MTKHGYVGDGNLTVFLEWLRKISRNWTSSSIIIIVLSALTGETENPSNPERPDGDHPGTVEQLYLLC